MLTLANANTSVVDVTVDVSVVVVVDVVVDVVVLIVVVDVVNGVGSVLMSLSSTRMFFFFAPGNLLDGL